ncbi:hypothetical protein VTN77DRAFT_6926 [Rasamsonia byssochlamydoides]|uniref:uncharacterized protein n=1 Tax=Rasamsonia byssochlamydoides TaxID=89139 RepID=UPI003743F9E6
MRVSVAAVVIAILSATTALAAPKGIKGGSNNDSDKGSTGSGSTNSGSTSSLSGITTSIVYAAQQGGCDFLDCAGVIAASACIAGSIATVDPLTLVGCAAGGEQVICGCAACINGLENFVTEHNICSSDSDSDDSDDSDSSSNGNGTTTSS